MRFQKPVHIVSRSSLRGFFELTMVFFLIRTPPISAPVKNALFEAEIRVKAGSMMKQARIVLLPA
jgi:hypothetical protein